MKEFITKSGAECVINCADGKDTRALRVTLLQVLKENGVEPPKSGKLDLAKIQSDLLAMQKTKVVELSTIRGVYDIFYAIETSDKLYKIVFDCLKRSTYNKERITEQTFEPEEAREDYYEIIASCIVENLRPFLKSLLSAL